VCRSVAHLLPGLWGELVAQLARWADGTATGAVVERWRENLGLANGLLVRDVERTARALRPQPAPSFLHAVYRAMETVRGFGARFFPRDYSSALSHALWAATFESGASIPRVNVPPWTDRDRPPFFSRFGRVPAAARNAGTARVSVGLCQRLRDVFGNPCRPVTLNPEWRTRDALLLAQQMYEAQEFSARIGIADALQEVPSAKREGFAGCDSGAILDHGRDAAQVHVRGCWVVDLVLGRE
jgi:hypothetical protein